MNIKTGALSQLLWWRCELRTSESLNHSRLMVSFSMSTLQLFGVANFLSSYSLELKKCIHWKVGCWKLFQYSWKQWLPLGCFKQISFVGIDEPYGQLLGVAVRAAFASSQRVHAHNVQSCGCFGCKRKVGYGGIYSLKSYVIPQSWKLAEGLRKGLFAKGLRKGFVRFFVEWTT